MSSPPPQTQRTMKAQTQTTPVRKTADYTGLGANHKSWKYRHRHKPHQLEEKMNKHWCNGTFNNLKSNIAPSKPSDPTTVDLKIPMQLKHKEMNIKITL